MVTKKIRSPQKAWGEGHEMAIKISKGEKKGKRKVIAKAYTLSTTKIF